MQTVLPLGSGLRAPERGRWVSTRRADYSGFMQWIHLTALGIFLFPYGWFLVRLYAVARFTSNGTDTIPMWLALLRFIWNGGQDWESGLHLKPWAFGAFVVALAYNILRGFLLRKTKLLELEEEARGLPVVFTLTGWWGRAHRAGPIGFYVNLLALLAHSIHFLMQEVPLPTPDSIGVP